MAATDIATLAANAATQGQQMLASDQNNAATYKGQYNQYQQAADAAQKGVSDYTDYMKNAGSAGNQYDTAFDTQKKELGYDPAQMTAARGNLNQSTGALSAYSDFANTAASKWGMNAGGFAAANAGALGSLNNNVASNQNVVNGLHDIYKTAQTGANQKTGLVISGEHETLGGLQGVYNNAANQRDSAGQMMQFFENLAGTQGGLNAQQQQYYAAAKASYAAASASAAQAAYLASQTHGQDMANQMTQNGMNSQQYKDYLAGKVDAQGKPIGQQQAVTSPPAAGGGLLSNDLNFWKHAAYGADAAQAAHAVGNWGKGLFTGASW